MSKRFFFQYFLLWMFLTPGIDSHAQYQGYRPVESMDAFQKEFADQSSKITSIESKFTQEKVLVALTEKIVSQGSFRFKKQSKIRIEYTKPFSYLMMINGDRLYLKENGKETRINVKSNKLFQQVNRIMVDCVQGTILHSRDFSSKAFENESTWLVEMIPTGKALRDFFDRIILVVDKRDSSVSSIEMREPSGDFTKMIFTEKKLNSIIPDEVFSF